MSGATRGARPCAVSLGGPGLRILGLVTTSRGSCSLPMVSQSPDSTSIPSLEHTVSVSSVWSYLSSLEDPKLEHSLLGGRVGAPRGAYFGPELEAGARLGERFLSRVSFVH